MNMNEVDELLCVLWCVGARKNTGAAGNHAADVTDSAALPVQVRICLLFRAYHSVLYHRI